MDEESVRMSRYYIVEGREDVVDTSASRLAIDREMCKRTETGATHVVTGIKWGFNAFMTFELETKDQTTKQEIGGSLRIMVKSIPGLAIEGSASMT